VEFVIDTSGEVLDESIKIKKSIFPSIDEEAIRVVRLLPKWKPGFSSELNKNAKVQMSIPIRFEVPVNNNKPSKTNNKK
jgi:periplasmic protein TonB